MIINFLYEFRERLAALGEPQNAAERVLFGTITEILVQIEEEQVARRHCPGKSAQWKLHYDQEMQFSTYVDGLLSAAEIYRREGQTP